MTPEEMGRFIGGEMFFLALMVYLLVSLIMEIYKRIKHKEYYKKKHNQEMKKLKQIRLNYLKKKKKNKIKEV